MRKQPKKLCAISAARLGSGFRLALLTLLANGDLLAGPSSATSQPTSQPTTQARPAARKGWAWRDIEPVHMGFFVPEAWHFSQAASKDGLGFRYGRENPQKGEAFVTGLTINVIQNVSKKTNIKPSLYAAHFAEQYTKDLKVTKEPALTRVGKLERLEFEVKKKQSEAGVDVTYRIHVHAVANDKTDTLYIIIFGALERDWDEEWKLGREILGHYFIDDDF